MLGSSISFIEKVIFIFKIHVFMCFKTFLKIKTVSVVNVDNAVYSVAEVVFCIMCYSIILSWNSFMKQRDITKYGGIPVIPIKNQGGYNPFFPLLDFVYK